MGDCVMRRLLCGLALTSLVLGGCSSTPEGRTSGFYNAPARAYTLGLESTSFRGGVRMSEQCDAKGGTLNIWDSNNRFFRVDYLKINKSPLAMVPAFSNERIMTDVILSNYLREVLPRAKSVKQNAVMFKDFVNTKRGDALLGIISLTMDEKALPEGVTDTNYYYGFLIFQQGDFAYVVQHRTDTFQPDRMKSMLVNLATEMTIPGHLRSELYENPAIEAKGESGYLGSIFPFGSKPQPVGVNCN